MLLSPALKAHFSVPFLVLVSAASAAFSTIPVNPPMVEASAAPSEAEVSFLPAGNTILVNTITDVSSGSDGLCSLREAISAANANIASGGSVGECGPGSSSDSDTINFSVTGTIDLGSELPDISSNLTINGPGSGLLTVRRNTGGDYRIFRITAGTVGISGLTVANGKTADGIAGNSGTNAEYGGGILNFGTLTLTGVNLSGNRTGTGGAGLNFGGFGGYGGALANMPPGTVTMTDCNVTGNITGNGGAGNNSVGDGGRGGGVYNENNLTMTNCSVNGNTTGDSGTTVGAGGRSGEGGGIYSRNGVLTLTNVTVNNNVTGSVPASNGGGSIGGNGGGIFTVLGTATLTNCTISGNQTGITSSGERGYGGGINNECPMTIIGSTISNNTGNAGAILNRRRLVITNSTFSGNHSIGINNSDSTSTLTLTNCTFSANDSYGVLNAQPASSAEVRNSIIAGSAAASGDVSGNFTSRGHNLIGVDAGGGFFGSSGFTNGINNDQVGTSASPLNARLAQLGNYGGPTQTHALLPGSPALDAGNNCVTEAAHCSSADVPQLTTDQRGFSRVVNSTVDIGAFESRGFTISVTSGSPQSTTMGSAFGLPLVATVSSSFAEPVANGLITFSAPTSGASGTFPVSVTSVTVIANGSGVATSPTFTANLMAGSYSVTAGGKGIASPASFNLTNSKASSSTSVSSSVHPSEFGENVTFTATVSTAAGVTPTGTVQFKDGVTDLGSPANCVSAPGNTCTAQFSTSTLSVGSHNISATYIGDGNLNGSTGSLSSAQVVKPVPTLSINDVSVTEGNSGTANLTFTVTLSAASNLTVTVRSDTANGTATSADNDYQSLTAGTVTFNPGELAKTVTVLVNGDQKTEPDETVFVVLSNPVNAAFSDSQGQGTILNDDTLQLLLDTSGPDANQLAALDSLLLIRDPFRIQNTATWFTNEPNTRVILFALDLQLNSGESPSVVKVLLVDGNGGTQEAAADDVRTIPNTTFSQVTFRLPNGVAAGTCSVSIKAHERISNSGTFRMVP